MARILIVDDVAQIRAYLAAVLKPLGHETIEAADGQEGLEAVRSGGVDLVISDGLMPVMDGFKLCLELKRSEATASIPFIFYTASFTHPEDQQLAGRLGADAYVLKPAEPKVIRETVERVLAAPASGAEGHVESETELVSLLDQYSGRIESKLDTKVVQLKATTESRDSFRSLLDNLPVAVVTLDKEGHLDFTNRLAAEFVGAGSEASNGAADNIREALVAEDLKSVSDLVRGVLEDPRPVEYMARARRHDGRVRRMKLSLMPYRSPEGDLLGLVVAALDVTEQEEHNELLRYLSEHDLLTGLPNRRVLDVRFEEVLERIGRGGKSALLFIDVDRFKSINDEFGHDVGDTALSGVARIIQEQVRGSDLVVRLCGDEFVVLCGDADADVARMVSERIRSAISAASLVPGAPERRLTVSIGLNLLPDAANSGQALREADEAMYRAKGAGRDRTVEIGPGAEPDSQSVDDVIERVLEDPDPIMMYAPVYSLEGGQLLWCATRPMFELLGGQVTEEELLSVATRRGMAGRVTKRVTESALREMSGTDILCSVRLSVSDVLDPSIFEATERMAHENGVEPSRLMFAVPFRHMLGGGLTETWLQSAGQHSIKLVLDAGDSDMGALLTAPLSAFSEIKLSAWAVSMDDNGPRPEARSLFQHLVEQAGRVTLMGLDTPELVGIARELGACCGQGLALSPLVTSLAEVPRQVEM